MSSAMSSIRRRGDPSGSSAHDHAAGSSLRTIHTENRKLLSKGPDESSAGALSNFLAELSLPLLLGWGLIVCLIFGGCCSNVFALEAIVKEEPESGLLITFSQFLITFLFTLPTHFSVSNPPVFLKKPAVPLIRWAPSILMFFAVNMMNNFAFGFQISVPVHIILRSGGSVTTMLVGYIWGRRYNRGQVLGVAMLTLGVIVAAMSDAQSKGKIASSSTSSSTASFLTGLSILFMAQLLSAVMGLYVQVTYARYGPHWNENLFYSHFLSLPLFVPFFPTLRKQFDRLLESPSVVLIAPTLSVSPQSQSTSSYLRSGLVRFLQPTGWNPFFWQLPIPVHLFTLALNSLTQYACIRGVNLLGARTSALGVTVVLNLRKLVSLFLSIWLFGNRLPSGVTVGAVIVFAGAGVYAWSGQTPPKLKPR